MRTAMQLSKPVERTEHLPYITEGEYTLPLVSQRLCPAARCYLNHDGSTPNLQRDLGTAVKLNTAGHMSPFEHRSPALAQERICRVTTFAAG